MRRLISSQVKPQKEPMKRLWTIIGVADVPASFKWYQSLLGLPETDPPHDERFGCITTLLPHEAIGLRRGAERVRRPKDSGCRFLIALLGCGLGIDGREPLCSMFQHQDRIALLVPRGGINSRWPGRQAIADGTQPVRCC